MSFITRCPSCGTAFKVVADQLKIADGWVRCGHCQQVFDATLDLQPAFAPLPAGGEPEVAAPTSLPTSEPPASEPPAPADDPVLPPAPAGPPGEPVEPIWEAPPVSPAPVAVPREAAEPGFDGAVPTAEPAPAVGAPVASPDGFADEPSFVRQARRRAFWRRPAVRAALALLGLLLAALLAGQAAWHWRDAWAARHPDSRPWLTAFCAHLGCTIAPPRRPRDVVIEGSVLLRRAPDRYSFHLVVRNNADIEIAAPALELTLTDLQDQVLVRRVWTPDAWPQPATRLAPGAEWPLQLELAFDHPQAARMTGYRAVLFYP